MRWWLALVFAGIAALTAVVVAQVFRSSSESAIRDRAAELTAGTAVAAAARIAAAEGIADARAVTAEVAGRRRVALFLFDHDGRLLSSDRIAGLELGDVPQLEAALASALEGRRHVETDGDTGSVTVALPIRGNPGVAGLVAFANRPDLEDALGIVRNEILSAAIRATLVGALVGLVVALLITRRLRRIAATAAAIEQGRFEEQLESRFPDELGELAMTVDQMRLRLARTFANLEGERDRLRRLLEQLQEAVVAVDRSLAVVFANSRARALLGNDAREGRPLPDPWPGFGLRAMANELFAPDAQPSSSTVRPEADTALVLAGLPPSSGSDTAVLVVTDVTLRERRERAEREFVANAAHELRTPLTAIGSAIDVLQHGAKDDRAQRDRFLSVVERQSNRLNGLVHALLTLARAQTRAETVRLERVPLAPFLRAAVEDTELDATLVEVDCPPDLEANAHPDLLRQALVNLVANAFTHGKGSNVRLSAREHDGVVRIVVADDGPGMSPEAAARALDRFYRGENGREGFGLGLAIVRELAHSMDAELAIETAPGSGTTVSLELARGIQESSR